MKSVGIWSAEGAEPLISEAQLPLITKRTDRLFERFRSTSQPGTKMTCIIITTGFKITPRSLNMNLYEAFLRSADLVCLASYSRSIRIEE